MAQVLWQKELPFDTFTWEFEGQRFGDTNVSFIIVEARPGQGPKLHSHPYEEVFIIQAGQATFTVGDETIEAVAGQVVIAPPNVPHAFINSGMDTLRQIDIHASPRMITTWY